MSLTSLPLNRSESLIDIRSGEPASPAEPLRVSRAHGHARPRVAVAQLAKNPDETTIMVLPHRRRVLLGLLACSVLGPGQGEPTLAASGKVRVLIVDGQNNHNWRAMTPPMKADLERSGRFTVDVATTPRPKAPQSAWDAFRPDFSKYDVVLSNYNGEPWPAGGSQGARGIRRQGGRPGDHPRGQ